MVLTVYKRERPISGFPHDPELSLKTHDCSLGFNLTMNLMLGKGTGAHWRKPGEARMGAAPPTIRPEGWPPLQGAPPPLPVD